MVVLFYKKKFIDFFPQNDIENSDRWIERVSQSNGWDVADVTVCHFDGITRQDRFMFDENCDLIKMQVDEKVVEDKEVLVDKIVEDDDGKKTIVQEYGKHNVFEVTPLHYAARKVIFSGGVFNPDAVQEPKENMKPLKVDSKKK